MDGWTPRLKKNGYMVPPVFDTPWDECHACGSGGDLVLHEIYFGNKNRNMSKRKGAYCRLCPTCHRIVHEKPDNGRLDRSLKRECFNLIVEDLNSKGFDGREIFYAWFGRYYD